MSKDEFLLLLQRMILSKKLIYTLVPVMANVIASFLGYDPSSNILLVLDAFFALLVVLQGILDLRFGSPSDGTTVAVTVAANEAVVKTNPHSDARMMSRKKQ